MEDGKSTSTGPMLLVFCDKRHVETIMQEFEDWNQKEGLEVHVVLHGITRKANDGFVLLEIKTPLPEGVYTNLVMDDDIYDYIQYNPLTPTVPPPA